MGDLDILDVMDEECFRGSEPVEQFAEDDGSENDHQKLL